MKKIIKLNHYLDDGLDIKLFIHFPWFWKCSKSKSNKNIYYLYRTFFLVLF